MIEPERKSITIPRVVKPKRKGVYGYIYITTNLINNKKYIGQHSCKTNDKNYLGSGTVLQKAIKKHGKDNFVSEPIDWATTPEELDEKEIWWISFLEAVDSQEYYNMSKGGDGLSSEEVKSFMTEHTIELFKKNSAGEHNGMYGKGHLVSGSKNGMYGRKHSDESIKKMRIVASQKTGGKNSFYGKKHSEETKEKNRQAHLGLKPSEETKKLFSAQKIGRKWIHNKDSEKFVNPNEVEVYLNNGWCLGRLPSHR